MEVTTKIIELNKRYPFTISRGTRKTSQNIFVFIKDNNHIGIGEFDANTIDNKHGLTAEEAIQKLQAFAHQHDLSKLAIHDCWQIARDENLPAPIIAALDMARWDLLGKQCHKPCYQLFGLSKRSVATSMTIGITSIDMIPDRIKLLLDGRNFHYLKIKLGSVDGIEFDKEAFLTIKKAAASYKVKLRVDANGGWNLANAKIMCQWLADQGVDYVEQPLLPDQDDALPELFKNRPLPIFIDESCMFSTDIPRFAHCVDGINIKLMKCGGITEAIRMVATARAHRLQTMIGCMSESSIAISAAASIGALFDHIDLDSHLNLEPDPANGAGFINGAIIPNNLPGHGADLC
jgi:L-alanine-DL-glutamate epimerase-like enolase superfamily enzyme